ncbi:MAG: sugar transferase [Bacteroidetes bacterium]|nr:sugar transferase [Bacteroidota bacterium]
MKRLLDLTISIIVTIFISPLLLLLALIIKVDSTGPVFYLQERIGKNRVPFRIFKFRTMYVNADKQGLLTVGERDARITRVGVLLRKYKLDELPQLFNVMVGNMSLVGPRPEVRKYVDLYSEEQLKVLRVKPGITDYASIEYANENQLLGNVSNPEEVYVNEIMPAKLLLNLKYIEEQSLMTDLMILLKTVRKIVS